jgi:hypothetical protein
LLSIPVKTIVIANKVSHRNLRPVPTVAESAAEISRNRTLITPVLRLSDDGWNASDDFAA